MTPCKNGTVCFVTSKKTNTKHYNLQLEASSFNIQKGVYIPEQRNSFQSEQKAVEAKRDNLITVANGNLLMMVNEGLIHVFINKTSIYH